MTHTITTIKEAAVKAITLTDRTAVGSIDARPAGRRVAQYALLALLGAALLALGLLTGGHLDALKAANLGGTAIKGVDDFIDGFTDNLKWLAGAVALAAVFVIGLLFLTGHSRAQDYAIRFGIGCAIIAGGTGIVA